MFFQNIDLKGVEVEDILQERKNKQTNHLAYVVALHAWLLNLVISLKLSIVFLRHKTVTVTHSDFT